jgi:hypothetical protein
VTPVTALLHPPYQVFRRLWISEGRLFHHPFRGVARCGAARPVGDAVSCCRRRNTGFRAGHISCCRRRNTGCAAANLWPWVNHDCFFIDRAQAGSAQMSEPPNFLHGRFLRTGDLFAVVKTLNGL